MRICLVGDATSIHIKRWVRWFSDRGHEIHLISDKPEEINGVRIHKLTIKTGAISFIMKIFQTRKIIKKIKPNIVHGHYLTSYGAWAAFSGFHPTVVTAWGSDVLVDPNTMIKRKMVKYALKKADIITCAGEYMKKAMTDLGADKIKIKYNYFGVDIQKFNPGQRSEKLRMKLGIFHSPMVISTRRLEPIYDVESLIKSIPVILKEAPDTKFVIAGNGTEKVRLENLVSSLMVSDNVEFIGWIPNEELPQYLSSADIYVCTSLSDSGLALSTREAMACELPVVTTDIEANKGWGIEDGENGYLIPSRDPESLAEKIIVLLRDKETRIKFGKISREIIKEKYEYNKDMETMENLYKEVVDIGH